MEEELKVDDILYRHYKRGFSDSPIYEYTVSKIGSKYIYVTDGGFKNEIQINKEDLTYKNKEYSQHNFQLYRSEQEIFDIIERSKLLSSIRDYIENYNLSKELTLEQLRSINDILKPDK